MKYFLYLFLPFISYSQMYQEEVLKNGDQSLPYRILFPENYQPEKAYPLLIFLHGAGERGSDNKAQLTHGASVFQEDSFRKKFPTIVVFPQCPSKAYWAHLKSKTPNPFTFYKKPKKNIMLESVEALITYIEQQFNIEENHVFIGGLSMGAMGTFELIHRNPKKFAAAFTICGGADPSWAKELKYTPLWIFHGGKDEVVPYHFSSDLYQSLKKENADVRFTPYPELNHNSWDAAFSEPNLLPWLFSHL